MITCTRRIQFCAGHRVHLHESKCAHLHGHNYVAFITASAPNLDSVGRVIDFCVLKEKVGGWIETYWDHGFILRECDTQAIKVVGSFKPQGQDDNSQKLFTLPYNPTAENMASYLLCSVCPRVLTGTHVTVTKIVLWETENCYAEVTL